MAFCHAIERCVEKKVEMETKSKVPCPYCIKTLSTVGFINRHIVKAHPDQELLPAETKPDYHQSNKERYLANRKRRAEEKKAGWSAYWCTLKSTVPVMVTGMTVNGLKSLNTDSEGINCTYSR